MKRTLLTAAFAALALGAVQATGIDWTPLWAVDGYGSVATDTSSRGRQTGIGLGTKWTVLANVTFNDISAINSGWPVLIGVSDNVDNNDANGHLRSPWRVLIDASHQTIGATDVTVADAPTLTTGTHEVAITGNDGTLSYYYDGTLLGSISVDTDSISAITWGQQRPDYNVLPGEWSMDIAYVDGMTYDEVGDAIAALPEPTALALLALGVAGVALRRRVA